MHLCQDVDENYCTLLEKKKDLSLLDDPYLWLMDPDSDPDPDVVPYPAIVVSDLQDVIEKLFFAYYFLKIHLHHF
jgi:hypothetical protein